MAGPNSVKDKAATIVTPGRYLGEVDAGWDVIGDSVFSGAFVSRHNNFDDAARVDSDDLGGLIVEMPQGVFSYYRTNLVSDDNVLVKGLDIDDSKDGLLLNKTFFGAWLELCSKNMCRAKPLKIY